MSVNQLSLILESLLLIGATSHMPDHIHDPQQLVYLARSIHDSTGLTAVVTLLPLVLLARGPSRSSPSSKTKLV